MNKLSINDRLSFKGQYFCYMQSGNNLHKIPSNPVESCVYADRMMIKTVSKILRKHPSEVDITVEEASNSIHFNVLTKTVKKNLPTFLKMTEGYFSDLNSPVFWRLISNEKVRSVSFAMNKNDFKKMVDYFLQPKKNNRFFIKSKEDKNIVSYIQNMKNILLKQKFITKDSLQALNKIIPY